MNNNLTSYLDSLAGLANAFKKPAKTTVINEAPPAASANGNGKLWAWVIGGLGVAGLIWVLVTFARKS